jgi:hypothetical protein
MNMQATFLKLCAVTVLCMTLNACYGVNLVSLNGPNLLHTNQGLLQFVNPSTSTTAGSVFLTSDQGNGYQAEIAPTNGPFTSKSGLFSTIGPKPQSLIECQQPLGNPVACAISCASHMLGAGSTYCTGIINTYYVPTTPGGAPPTDLLNENKSVAATAYKYVFLDTIVNNSTSSFEIATTTAPLYSSNPDIQPNTIAGAIAAGNLNIFKNLYSLKPSGNFTIGKNSYPLTFLNDSTTVTDNRYLIAAADKHNPAGDALAIKRHMANKNIALDTTKTNGIQTIILFPNRMQSTCQPIIFIGRDEDNGFYALTYLGTYTSTTQQQCCVSSGTTACTTDMLYPSSNLPTSIQTNLDDTDPTFVRLGQPGRLALDIECIAGTGGYGYAAQLKSLPGPWYTGQIDFSTIPATPTPCTS